MRKEDIKGMLLFGVVFVVGFVSLGLLILHTWAVSGGTIWKQKKKLDD